MVLGQLMGPQGIELSSATRHGTDTNIGTETQVNNTCNPTSAGEVAVKRQQPRHILQNW